VIELTLRTPSTACIKRRTNERITATVAVKAQGATQPEHLIVEAWTSVHNNRAQPVAIRLQFMEREGDLLIYSSRIALKHVGFFRMQFRARRTADQYWTWLEENGKRKTMEIWVDPEWVYDTIMYNAFVRYFGAQKIEQDGQVTAITSGTFDDVRKELEKLRGMGVNVLYLNPVHQIGELYRNYNPHDLLPEYLQPGCPYSVKDYKSIDPELSFGDDPAHIEHPFTEFRKLVDEAHRQGMRVFMDLVFNHSAHDAVFQRIHPEWFLYKEDIWSLEAPYLYPDDIKQGKPWGDPKHTFSPYDHGWWWKDAAQLNWNNIADYDPRFSPKTAPNEPPLNPTIDDMYEYFKGIVKFWIKEFGIDGFRCDVAYRVPMDFWKQCILEAQTTAREAYPQNGSIDGTVVFIAEAYYLGMQELLQAGFTSCCGDISNKMHALPELTGYIDYMLNINGKHFPEGTLWWTFPECHDFHRTPEKIAKELREHHKDADLNANKSRWTITACLPGLPMIFNGFEKIEWQPASLFSYSTIDWESDKDISEHIERVNLIRRREATLQRGRYYYLHTSEGITTNSKLLTFARLYDKEAIIVAVNINLVEKADHITVHLTDDLPIDYAKPYVLHDLLTGSKYERSGKDIQIVLEPGEAHIFKVLQA
jgi:alpha-amylase